MNLFIFLRYIDDIFLTSNDTLQNLQRMLNNMNHFHPNIKLTEKIGNCVNFLDVQVITAGESFITSIHHKDSVEPYILPFRSDHLRHVFANVIATALLRAIRYCSSLDKFNHERRQIKLMLLYNGYEIQVFIQLRLLFIVFLS